MTVVLKIVRWVVVAFEVVFESIGKIFTAGLAYWMAEAAAWLERKIIEGQRR